MRSATQAVGRVRDDFAGKSAISGVVIMDTNIEQVSVIERVMQWVFAEQRMRMPWMVNTDLAFNRGLTARPKRAGDGGWATSAMSAGMGQGKTRMRLAVTPHPQANLVMDRVKLLPARSAALVITHGRKRTRPDEMVGAEARLRPVWVIRRMKGIDTPFPKIVNRDKYGNYGSCLLGWVDGITPGQIASAREDGQLWRKALAQIAAEMDGMTINGWYIGAAERAA